MTVAIETAKPPRTSSFSRFAEVEVGDAPVAEARGESGRDDRVEGADPVAEEARRHEQQNGPDRGIPPAEARAPDRAERAQLRNLNGDLQQSADEDPGREPVRRLGKARRQHDGAARITRRSGGSAPPPPPRSAGARSEAPGSRAASETKQMYGKIQRLRSTVSSNLPGSARSPPPGRARATAREDPGHGDGREDDGERREDPSDEGAGLLGAAPCGHFSA